MVKEIQVSQVPFRDNNKSLVWILCLWLQEVYRDRQVRSLIQKKSISLCGDGSTPKGKNEFCFVLFRLSMTIYPYPNNRHQKFRTVLQIYTSFIFDLCRFVMVDNMRCYFLSTSPSTDLASISSLMIGIGRYNLPTVGNQSCL